MAGMSEGPKTALKLLGVGLVYGIAWFGAYSTQDWQWLLGLLLIAVFALNVWIISSALPATWEQPWRAFASIGLALIPTYLATLASFAAAAETFGV